MDSTDISRRTDEVTNRFERLEEPLPPIPASAVRLTRATAHRVEADLHEPAQELDIDGRSSMSEHELMRALRSA